MSTYINPPNNLNQSYSTLAIKRHGTHVVIVTLNRPEVANAFNTRMSEEPMQFFEDFSLDAGDLRCAVLSGAGEKDF